MKTIRIIQELLAEGNEMPWLEFKANHTKAEEIGKYISALANSAALNQRNFGYLVWGVDDKSRALIGTTFNPHQERIGNEELESWLLGKLRPRVNFSFNIAHIDGMRVVLLRVERATTQPVQFQNVDYIRIGTTTRSLKDFPEKERALWKIFETQSFERNIAAEGVTSREALGLLDSCAYFSLLELPVPDDEQRVLDALERDAIVARSDQRDRWNITNLGAILLARDLSEFKNVARKAPRIIFYSGQDRIRTMREHVWEKGYACGFEESIALLAKLLPSNEIIAKSLRKTVPMYPVPAIRELVANALIHQDFSVTGAGPMIEVFDKRIEITNPGEPLIEADRLLDSPPRSRNEELASLMRRFRICEERGSGIDKVVFEAEFYQLPAPLFEVPPGSTRSVLFAHRPVSEMDRDDRIRACYLHACLKYVQNSYLTNSSLRERFGIEERNKASVSRYIREALDAGVIVPRDKTASRRMMSYVPWWAKGKRH